MQYAEYTRYVTSYSFISSSSLFTLDRRCLVLVYIPCMQTSQAIVAEKLNIQTKRMAAFQQSSTSLQSVKDIIAEIRGKLEMHRTVFVFQFFENTYTTHVQCFS